MTSLSCFTLMTQTHFISYILRLWSVSFCIKCKGIYERVKMLTGAPETNRANPCFPSWNPEAIWDANWFCEVKMSFHHQTETVSRISWQIYQYLLYICTRLKIPWWVSWSPDWLSKPWFYAQIIKDSKIAVVLGFKYILERHFEQVFENLWEIKRWFYEFTCVFKKIHLSFCF